MPLYRGSRGLILRRRVPAVVVGPSLALNGTPQTANAGSSGTSMALPAFTTTVANTVVVVALIHNDSVINAPTSANLTFARQPGLTPPLSGASKMDIWYAVAASTLSSEVITTNFGVTAFTTAIVFAVSGAKTSAPFDVNAAIPSTTTTGTPATITTTASNTFAFGMLVDSIDRSSGTSPAYALLPSVGATANGNFLYLAYRIASAPLSGEAFQSGGSGASIATAIQQGP